MEPRHIRTTREQYFKVFGLYPPRDANAMAVWVNDSIVAIYTFADEHVDEIGDEVDFLEALYRL